MNDFQFLPPADPSVQLPPDFTEKVMEEIRRRGRRYRRKRLGIILASGALAALALWVVLRLL